MVRTFLGLEKLLGFNKEENMPIRENSEIFQRCPSENGQIRKMTLTNESIPDSGGLHHYKCTECRQLYVPRVNKFGENSIIRQNCPVDGENYMEITSEILPDTMGKHFYRCLGKCKQLYVGKEHKK